MNANQNKGNQDMNKRQITMVRKIRKIGLENGLQLVWKAEAGCLDRRTLNSLIGQGLVDIGGTGYADFYHLTDLAATI